MVETITLWTTIASSAVGIVSTLIAILSNKKKGKSQKLVELAKIVQKLPEYIQTAENIFGGGTGTAKMAWVLQQVRMECLTNKVNYNEEQFKVEIENILATPTTIKKESKNG